MTSYEAAGKVNVISTQSLRPKLVRFLIITAIINDT